MKVAGPIKLVLFGFLILIILCLLRRSQQTPVESLVFSCPVGSVDSGVLAAVMSAPANWRRRDLLRRTWARDDRITTRSVQCSDAYAVFAQALVGRAPLNSVYFQQLWDILFWFSHSDHLDKPPLNQTEKITRL